jgi:hypothetical protein
VAYNEKSRIWVSDTLYARYFSERTTASHIVFAYSLLRAVEDKKAQLIAAQAEGTITDKQEKILSFLRNRGATFLLVTAIASSLETIVGRPIPDRFGLQFKDACSPQDATNLWMPIVNVASAFAEKLTVAVERGLKNAEQVNTVVADFTSFMDAVSEANAPVYTEFAQHLAGPKA